MAVRVFFPKSELVAAMEALEYGKSTGRVIIFHSAKNKSYLEIQSPIQSCFFVIKTNFKTPGWSNWKGIMLLADFKKLHLQDVWIEWEDKFFNGWFFVSKINNRNANWIAPETLGRRICKDVEECIASGLIETDVLYCLLTSMLPASTSQDPFVICIKVEPQENCSNICFSAANQSNIKISTSCSVGIALSTSITYTLSAVHLYNVACETTKGKFKALQMKLYPKSLVFQCKNISWVLSD